MDDIDKLLANLDPSTPPAQKPKSVAGGVSSSVADPLLAQMKQEYAIAQQTELIKQREQLLEQQRQQELLERQKQQRQEQLRDRQRQELHTTAETWLKTLKPKTEEARWFEEFACNYESRLEAAVEYLAALQELDHTHPSL